MNESDEDTVETFRDTLYYLFGRAAQNANTTDVIKFRIIFFSYHIYYFL